MIVMRRVKIEVNRPKIGDRIRVGHYTATRQEITPKGALFLLDQYLDRAYQMNRANTNKGGYAESDLRKALQSDEVLNVFASIRDYMVPFDNGDLLRLPFAGELFDKLPSWCEPDDHKQWPLMKDAHNRAASRCGEPEWGWLANTVRDTATDFCSVSDNGAAYDCYASDVLGVRPVFQIAQCKDKEPALRDFDNLEYGRVNPDRTYVLKKSGICYEYH